MIDKTALYQEGVPFIVELERGKIIEFARSIHSEHEEYLETKNLWLNFLKSFSSP